MGAGGTVPSVSTVDPAHYRLVLGHFGTGVTVVTSVDADGARAEQTRRDFLARYADRPVLVIGTHFATPTAGRIVRDGAAYRFAT